MRLLRNRVVKALGGAGCGCDAIPLGRSVAAVRRPTRRCGCGTCGSGPWRPGRQAAAIGLTEPGSCPAEHRILANAAHALSRWLG